MGVSVRLTRNTRAYVPWWLAVPGFVVVAGVWVVAGVVWLLAMLLAVWPARLLSRKGGG